MRTPWEVDRARLGWWGVGAVLAVVFAYVVLSFVGTFVFGVFLYYATRPLHRRLKRRIRPPSLAAMVSLIGIALPVILLLAYTIAIGLQELGRFADRTDIAVVERYVGPYLNVSQIPQAPEELVADGGFDTVREVLASATVYLGFLGTAALHLFVMIAIAFYLLRDDYRLSRWVRRQFGDEAGVLESFLTAIDHSYHQVFFGNILNAALTATIGALVYSLLDFFAPVGLAIPYPMLLGLLAGAASLIPIVGMKLVYVPATLYLAAVVALSSQPRLLWFPAAFAALSFVVVDTIPDLVLRPYVSGRDLHVGMVMLAYVFGPLLFGWYGIFLGPMLLVLLIHFSRLVLPELVAGVPLRPAAVDPTNIVSPPPEALPEDPSETDVEGSPGDDG